MDSSKHGLENQNLGNDSTPFKYLRQRVYEKCKLMVFLSWHFKLTNYIPKKR